MRARAKKDYQDAKKQAESQFEKGLIAEARKCVERCLGSCPHNAEFSVRGCGYSTYIEYSDQRPLNNYVLIKLPDEDIALRCDCEMKDPGLRLERSGFIASLLGRWSVFFKDSVGLGEQLTRFTAGDTCSLCSYRRVCEKSPHKYTSSGYM